PDMPLTRLLDDAAEAFPGNVAIAAAGTTLTYRRLRELVDRFAGGLAAIGVAPGDRVALVLPNCPQHVIAFFAVLRLGATVVQCNPLGTVDELRRQLVDARPVAAICLDKSFDVVQAVRADAGIRTVVVTTLIEYLPPRERLRLSLPLPSSRAARRRLLAPVDTHADVVRYRDLLSAPPSRQAAVDPASDVAVLQYTGGTTGIAKG